MLFLLACTSPDVTSPDTADSADDVLRCNTTVQETWPSDGAVDFYYRDSISFTLSEPDATAHVVADFAGEQTVSDDGLVVSYTPTEPLAPNADYAVALDYCHGTPTISFRTSPFGEPLEDGLDLTGRGWGFTLADAHSIQPAQVAELAANFFSNMLLVGVAGVGTGSIDVRMAVAVEGDVTQDWCAQTFDVEGIALEGPWFNASPRDISFDAYGTTFTLYGGEVSGTIAADGGTLSGVRVAGLLDGVPIAQTNLHGDVAALCGVVENLGGECVECPSGDWGCFEFEMDRIEAVAIAVPVEPIEDSYTDPRCEAPAE